MQSVAVAASEHHTSGEFVDDDDLSVTDHVVNVPLHHVAGLQGLLDVMVDLHVLRIRKVLDPEVVLTFLDTFFGQGDLVVLFLDGEVLMRV